MSAVDAYVGSAAAWFTDGSVFGLVTGIVTNNQDPQHWGRVKLKFPLWSDLEESDWARIAVPMSGPEFGFYALPEVDDEVLVAFAHGDPRCPFVLGMLWNGKDVPPAKNEDGKNDLRTIKSRSGHVIRFNDKAGEEVLEIHSGHGHGIVVDNTGIKITDKDAHTVITLDANSQSLSISASQDLTLSAPKGTLKLSANAVEISGTASAALKSSAVLELRGSLVKIN